MTFAEWLAIILGHQGHKISDYPREQINLLRRAFQAGEMNMRAKASLRVEDEDLKKKIKTIKLDNG